MTLSETDPCELAQAAGVNLITASRFLHRLRSGTPTLNTAAARKLRAVLAQRGLLPPATPSLPHSLPLDKAQRAQCVSTLAQIIATLSAEETAMLTEAVARQVATARAEFDAQGRAVQASA